MFQLLLKVIHRNKEMYSLWCAPFLCIFLHAISKTKKNVPFDYLAIVFIDHKASQFHPRSPHSNHSSFAVWILLSKALASWMFGWTSFFFSSKYLSKQPLVHGGVSVQVFFHFSPKAFTIKGCSVALFVDSFCCLGRWDDGRLQHDRYISLYIYIYISVSIYLYLYMWCLLKQKAMPLLTDSDNKTCCTNEKCAAQLLKCCIWTVFLPAGSFLYCRAKTSKMLFFGFARG